MWDLYFYYLENICYSFPAVKLKWLKWSSCEICTSASIISKGKHFLAFSSYRIEVKLKWLLHIKYERQLISEKINIIYTLIFLNIEVIFLDVFSNVCVCVEDKLQIALIFSLPFNFSAVSAADCFSPPREQETYKTYKIQPSELPLQITSCQNSSPQ